MAANIFPGDLALVLCDKNEVIWLEKLYLRNISRIKCSADWTLFSIGWKSWLTAGEILLPSLSYGRSFRFYLPFKLSRKKRLSFFFTLHLLSSHVCSTFKSLSFRYFLNLFFIFTFCSLFFLKISSNAFIIAWLQCNTFFRSGIVVR